MPTWDAWDINRMQHLIYTTIKMAYPPLQPANVDKINAAPTDVIQMSAPVGPPGPPGDIRRAASNTPTATAVILSFRVSGPASATVAGEGAVNGTDFSLASVVFDMETELTVCNTSQSLLYFPLSSSWPLSFPLNSSAFRGLLLSLHFS